MGFLEKFFSKRKQIREEGDILCSEIISSFHRIDEKIEDILKDDLFYIDPELSHDLHTQFKEVEKRAASNSGIIRRSKKHGELVSKKNATERLLSTFENSTSIHNRKVTNDLISINSELLRAEGKEFDLQQKECIVKNVHNHIVISGAGTGKTITIVGKVKYLLETGTCDPKKLIVLSFTRDTASELKHRIKAETGQDIDVSTFHKLGMNIIERTSNQRPKISETVQYDFIRRSLNELSKGEGYRERLILYATEIEDKERRRYGAEKKLDEKRHREDNPIVTRKGDKVRSYGEKDIADYLFVNKIEYVYESAYKVDENGTKYRPDFYLPKNNIYIEYYGIDRNGGVPPYFSSRDGKSPSETYGEGIKWKRDLHMEKGTTLVEVFAYEKWEGVLLSNLREKLEDIGVKFQQDLELPIDIYTVDSIAKTFESLLNRIKSKNISMDDVRAMILSDQYNAAENELALSLFEPIFEDYLSSLRMKGEMDFDDMINKATQCVKKEGFVHDYDHVLIDEYQDISDSRFNLLYEMRKKKDFSLFAVGDDWQSIYGFTGSNLSYLYDFEKCWGVSEKSKVETTYRFPEKLIKVSGKFIMENPKQVPKQLNSKSSDDFSLVEIRDRFDDIAMSGVIQRLLELPHGSSVFFLGRYDSDKQVLFKDTRLDVKGPIIEIKGREDLEVSFLTVHRSKGLQADCVVILNNKDDIMGFPSKLTDPAIVRLLGNNVENYPFSEERRVYYVAMTRAKRMLILLTLDDTTSPFVKEILVGNQDLIEKNYWHTCPKCGGRMLERSGKYGPFLGCSNYSINNCDYKEQIKGSSK